MAVPEFAADVLRRRMAALPDVEGGRTIFANRRGGPLSSYNVRRTFRAFLDDAGLADIGISLRWYRRTGATVIARGAGTDAAASFLGHTSSVITEGHYIAPVPGPCTGTGAGTGAGSQDTFAQVTGPLHRQVLCTAIGLLAVRDSTAFSNARPKRA